MEDQKVKIAGRPLLDWEVDEFMKHDRSPAWYIVAAVIGLSLIIYAVATANFLFAVIMLMIGIIILISSFTEPNAIEVFITTMGVVVGDSFYEYKDIKDFAVIYEPPEVNLLYLNFKSPWQPVMAIPLKELDPNTVREILLNYLAEDLEQEEERLTDVLRRLYKL
ncbi:hypothetical protein KJ611_03780 [Patescibacteria group bacterium]|nr:hypothetical protein [Patescibacteria group bacterium]MBU1705725.1 hypothetical protein [Patescibacteria group bacterium]